MLIVYLKLNNNKEHHILLQLDSDIQVDVNFNMNVLNGKFLVEFKTWVI